MPVPYNLRAQPGSIRQGVREFYHGQETVRLLPRTGRTLPSVFDLLQHDAGVAIVDTDGMQEAVAEAVVMNLAPVDSVAPTQRCRVANSELTSSCHHQISYHSRVRR